MVSFESFYILSNSYVCTVPIHTNNDLTMHAMKLMKQKDSKEKHKGFGDFFPLYTEEFHKRVPIITMQQFLNLEGGNDGQFPIPEDARDDILRTAPECDKRAKSDIACEHILTYLEAAAFVPQFNTSHCIVFDEDMFETGHISEDNKEAAEQFCSPREVRQPRSYLYGMHVHPNLI